VFCANLANLGAGGGLLPRGVRPTIVMFARELASPVPVPPAPVADWINKNIPDGGTVSDYLTTLPFVVQPRWG
jgi:hypothetical protein